MLFNRTVSSFNRRSPVASGVVLVKRTMSFKNAGFRNRSEMRANWLFAALLGVISGELRDFCVVLSIHDVICSLIIVLYHCFHFPLPHELVGVYIFKDALKEEIAMQQQMGQMPPGGSASRKDEN